MRTFAALFAALTVLTSTLPATAQETTTPSEQTQSAPAAPTWQGLPFTSLADFETQIPIGMSRRDVVRTLGRPETTMPGQQNDLVYHYLYQSSDGSQIRAVIILRENAVFIRRLYISTANGETSRAN